VFVPVSANTGRAARTKNSGAQKMSRLMQPENLAGKCMAGIISNNRKTASLALHG
jgi:hypothetical protein